MNDKLKLEQIGLPLYEYPSHFDSFFSISNIIDEIEISEIVSFPRFELKELQWLLLTSSNDEDNSYELFVRGYKEPKIKIYTPLNLLRYEAQTDTEIATFSWNLKWVKNLNEFGEEDLESWTNRAILGTTYENETFKLCVYTINRVRRPAEECQECQKRENKTPEQIHTCKIACSLVK